jgi:hypothetical protein
MKNWIVHFFRQCAGWSWAVWLQILAHSPSPIPSFHGSPSKCSKLQIRACHSPTESHRTSLTGWSKLLSMSHTSLAPHTSSCTSSHSTCLFSHDHVQLHTDKCPYHPALHLGCYVLLESLSTLLGLVGVESFLHWGWGQQSLEEYKLQGQMPGWVRSLSWFASPDFRS